MPPKAVVYHICGQHLAGEALCGYAVGPDTPIFLSPKLILRGGAVVQRRPALAAPRLVLYGKTFTFGRPFGVQNVAAPKLLLGGSAVVGGLPSGARDVLAPNLYLRGGAAVGGPPPGPRITGTPELYLLSQPTGLAISQTLTMSRPEIFLLAEKAVGKEKGMVGTRPVDWILEPTIDLISDLEPTVEEDWLLVPTTERDM